MAMDFYTNHIHFQNYNIILMDCIFLNTGSLTEEELDIQLKEWCGEEGYPKGHTLTMVMSGDIAEILNYR